MFLLAIPPYAVQLLLWLIAAVYAWILYILHSLNSWVFVVPLPPLGFGDIFCPHKKKENIYILHVCNISYEQKSESKSRKAELTARSHHTRKPRLRIYICIYIYICICIWRYICTYTLSADVFAYVSADVSADIPIYCKTQPLCDTANIVCCATQQTMSVVSYSRHRLLWHTGMHTIRQTA